MRLKQNTLTDEHLSTGARPVLSEIFGPGTRRCSADVFGGPEGYTTLCQWGCVRAYRMCQQVCTDYGGLGVAGASAHQLATIH